MLTLLVWTLITWLTYWFLFPFFPHIELFERDSLCILVLKTEVVVHVISLRTEYKEKIQHGRFVFSHLFWSMGTFFFFLRALSSPYTIVLLLRGFFLFAGNMFQSHLAYFLLQYCKEPSFKGHLFLLFSFLRVCICVYVGLCVHMCFCVLRPEVNVGYVSHYFKLYFVRLSLTEPRAQWLSRLICWQACGSCLLLSHSKHWSYKCPPPCPANFMKFLSRAVLQY